MRKRGGHMVDNANSFSIELAGWNAATKNLTRIRPLTCEEIAADKRFRPIIAEARERLKLFKILDLNYKDWEQRLEYEMTPGKGIADDHIELDKLMLNFLSTVYAISEHFSKSYRRRFRKDKNKLQALPDFVQRLHKHSWAVAFFSDFRGYVQHCALPVGKYTRNATRHGVRINVTHDAATLCESYRDWENSELTPEHGTLDLIDLTHECYKSVRQYYGSFMASAFYPELEDVDAFYWTLTQEVKKAQPKSKMVFLTQHEVKKNRARTEIKVTLVFPPNALFEELGIKANNSNTGG